MIADCRGLGTEVLPLSAGGPDAFSFVKNQGAVNALVIGAAIAVKRAVEEDGTPKRWYSAKKPSNGSALSWRT